MPCGYAQIRPQAMDILCAYCWESIDAAKDHFRSLVGVQFHFSPTRPNTHKDPLRHPQVLVNIAPFDQIYSHGAVPSLANLIESVWQQLQIPAHNLLGPLPPHPSAHSDRVRMAHMRLHMVDYKYSDRASSFTYWTTFDRQLLELAEQDETYQTAHAQAILIKDHELFNGTNTIASIPRANRRLPNEAEINARLVLIEQGQSHIDLHG
ncbi:uncharacterized protein PGTG_22708 [Puccinia graminis f. sp. tritici CRL 75-36-700-3]|uniref:Uncharacterized protein n=1 Tax=Puccinia graminis f. sp. tritici (strain CRL 75-36-700-3 / race SCCL) TaxID=418459 RepID=H6QVD2_PUCGT|nr:uncharacterized protein PGTG_22708 [Puccinia graminis f. sp. tritici CRL 75-36-700-3]EHS62861.1 hypothetical protein PGTG_22708 [Puccinia graminis f. sp. tritici CRL 75-36-700-3]